MKKPDRVFIVGPNRDGDTLYKICSTSNHRNSIFDIYQIDDYEEQISTGSKGKAILLAEKVAKKLKFNEGRIITI